MQHGVYKPCPGDRDIVISDSEDEGSESSSVFEFDKACFRSGNSDGPDVDDWIDPPGNINENDVARNEDENDDVMNGLHDEVRFKVYAYTYTTNIIFYDRMRMTEPMSLASIPNSARRLSSYANAR